MNFLSKIAKYCLIFWVCAGFFGCYTPPTLQKEAIGIKIYRGKSGLQGCTYLLEVMGAINTKGYGLSLAQAIQAAEIDIKNKTAHYGGDAVLVLQVESKSIHSDYNFNMGMGVEKLPSKIDEYIIHGEAYKCNN